MMPPGRFVGVPTELMLNHHLDSCALVFAGYSEHMCPISSLNFKHPVLVVSPFNFQSEMCEIKSVQVIKHGLADGNRQLPISGLPGNDLAAPNATPETPSRKNFGTRSTTDVHRLAAMLC